MIITVNEYIYEVGYVEDFDFKSYDEIYYECFYNIITSIDLVNDAVEFKIICN
jgi:hypothetical protein